MSVGEALQAGGELIEMAGAFGVDEDAVLLGPVRHERVESLAGVDLKFLRKALSDLARESFQARGDLAVEGVELLREALGEFSFLTGKSLAGFGDEPSVLHGG